MYQKYICKSRFFRGFLYHFLFSCFTSGRIGNDRILFYNSNVAFLFNRHFVLLVQIDHKFFHKTTSFFISVFLFTQKVCNEILHKLIRFFIEHYHFFYSGCILCIIPITYCSSCQSKFDSNLAVYLICHSFFYSLVHLVFS